MNAQTRSPGVTLVELLVVVTIIGLIVGIGMPNLVAYMQRQRLQAAALNLANHLNATRLLAMLKGVPHEIQLKDFEHGNYYQAVESNEDRIVSGIGRVMLNREFAGIKLVKIPAFGKLKFSPSGTSASTTIELEGNQKTRIKIIVSNGRVRIDS